MRKSCCALVCAVIVAGCGTVNTVTPKDPSGATVRQRQDFVAHKVVLVMLENKDVDEVTADCPATKVRASNLSFFQTLGKKGALLCNYFAVAHPSQPNYVALISGSTAGVPADRNVVLSREHLGGGKEWPADKGWKVYSEGYPRGACHSEARIGKYARKHNPFVSFADVTGHVETCASHVTDFVEFEEAVKARSLPAFSLVIPDLEDDAHGERIGGSSAEKIAVANTWLERHLGPLLNDADFAKEVLLIVTFDENDAHWPYPKTGNRVFAALVGPDVKPRAIGKAVYDHYDMLRTIEAVLGVPPMKGEKTDARVIGEIWQ